MSDLKDLIGGHILDAVDESNESICQYDDVHEDCSVLRFRLDGIVYCAIEDPSDGYRSMMSDLVVDGEAKMTNEFPGIRVVCIRKDKYDTCASSDVIQIYDAETGLLVVEVGTDNDDDYYPSFVASFMPENMVTNRGHIQADKPGGG